MNLHTALQSALPVAEPQPRSATTPSLRVLHVYKSWTPVGYGGVEQVITTLGIGGREHGIASRVAYLGPGRGVARIRFQGISAYRFPLDLNIASTGLSLSLYAAYRRLAAWADVLHFHFPWPYGDMVHLLSGVRKPMVVTYHLDITRQRMLNWLYRPVMHRFLRQADLLVATSENALRTSPVLRRFSHKTQVIPLGLDDRCRGQAIPIRMAQWRHRIDEGFVLFVGVLRYYKGLQYLVEAAKTIRGRIVIAGAGPCERALKAQASRAGLSNVTFLGQVEDVDKQALYRLCSLFVFPSHLRSEGFGLALVEAAMHGKPMVSCGIGTGTSFVNIHEQTGLVVEPRNPAALSRAVTRLLKDHEARERFGRNARARYEEWFTARSMTAAYAAAYRRVMNGASACRR